MNLFQMIKIMGLISGIRYYFGTAKEGRDFYTIHEWESWND